jgi:hypothetical protein
VTEELRAAIADLRAEVALLRSAADPRQPPSV